MSVGVDTNLFKRFIMDSKSNPRDYQQNTIYSIQDEFIEMFICKSHIKFKQNRLININRLDKVMKIFVYSATQLRDLMNQAEVEVDSPNKLIRNILDNASNYKKTNPSTVDNARNLDLTEDKIYIDELIDFEQNGKIFLIFFKDFFYYKFLLQKL